MEGDLLRTTRIEYMREFWDEALKRLKTCAEAAQQDSEFVADDRSTGKVLNGRDADPEAIETENVTDGKEETR
jgi:hypothetical protein